jgi:hypothetical protein
LTNTGCHTYGSHEVQVAFSTDPAGCVAYLVPLDVWPANAPLTQPYVPQGADFLNLLAPYRINDGRTPVTIWTAPYQMEYVVGNTNGQFRWTEVNLLRQRSCSLSFQ